MSTSTARSCDAIGWPQSDQVIEGLTAESLDADTEPVEGPGWPEPRSYAVREWLLCILNEEWEHRLYAERDLDALEGSAAANPL
jgi:hypothetical protein